MFRSGVVYLHGLKNPLIHRDLSDKNVLLTETGVVKIADFGQAKLLGDLNDILQTTQPGAVLYMPPEALKKKKGYTAKVDSFSLGVLMLEICTQSPPSSGLDGINYEIEVKRREDDLRLLDDAHPLKPLIVWCLQYEELRPTVAVIQGFIKNDVQSKVRMVVHASYLWFTFATCSMEACIYVATVAAASACTNSYIPHMRTYV